MNPQLRYLVKVGHDVVAAFEYSDHAADWQRKMYANGTVIDTHPAAPVSPEAMNLLEAARLEACKLGQVDIAEEIDKTIAHITHKRAEEEDRKRELAYVLSPGLLAIRPFRGLSDSGELRLDEARNLHTQLGAAIEEASRQ
jgi:hypothetical protein